MSTPVAASPCNQSNPLSAPSGLGGARVFLTGGTGFFGRALLRHWVGQFRQGRVPPAITLLTREPDLFISRHAEFRGLPWLQYHKGDILVPGSLPQGESFSHILHAAADSTLGPRLSHLLRYRQIVDGTRNMLEFAASCGARRFLLTSSGGVYGPQPADMEKIPEDYNGMPDPLDPANAYGVAKRAAEHLCAMYAESCGIQPVIARCFAFVGPDLPLDVHFAIGNFIRDALYGTEIVIAGDGTPVRSYLDQRDLATWLLTMLEKGRAGRAYNVGSDQAITIEELAHLVRDIIRPDLPVRKLGNRGANSFRNRYLPDITRARNELALDITMSLKDSIRHCAQSVAPATTSEP